MALNNRSIARIATRFERLLVKLSPFKATGSDQGSYGGSPLFVIQAPPNQTADIMQVQDSTGNVTYSIASSGRPLSNPPAKALASGSPTSLADVAVAASAMVGGVIHYL